MNEWEMKKAIMRWKANIGLIAPNIWLPSGEADILLVTWSGFAYEYEIKTSLADFKNDFKKISKHQVYKLVSQDKNWFKEISSALVPNYFCYIFSPNVNINKEDIPDYAGAYKLKKDCNPYYNDSWEIIKRNKYLHKEKLDWTMFMAKSLSSRMAYRYKYEPYYTCPHCGACLEQK
ncbi:hypothetical protein M0R19_05960 [Candidatus Pacearchaeota archaeon]|nr:hypothetical protein [Candidatus Pacearchaeota archaeon]